MLAIKNLEGDVFLLTGASNIVHKRRVNGEKELSLKLEKTKQNAHYFDDIDKLWRIIFFNGEEYPVLLYRDVAEGNDYTREISCLHSFFDDMRNHVIYEVVSGSKTFTDMMNFIFRGSGYVFKVVSQFFAQEFENFGDDYGLELFKTAIERYKAEFTVTGKTVTFRDKIGNLTDFQYRHKFNLESIEREVDALDFSTYGEGFGKDGLHVVYRSPLADKYGDRPIKAIRDDRFTNAESLTARVKEAVDSSLKITLTVKLSDLRASGYNKNHPDEGDIIILFDDRLGLKVDTRIVEIVELHDKKGKVLDCDVTLSNFSNIFEQQRRIHNAAKTIADAVEGKRPLPFEALAIAVQQATIALQNAQTELEFPDNGGILAIDKTNPNKLVLFNSAGIGISSDGGQTFRTAMTGDGIVADLITVGTLRGIYLEGVEITGSKFLSEAEGSSTVIEGGNIRSTGSFSRDFGIGEFSTYVSTLDSYNGVVRVGITSKIGEDGVERVLTGGRALMLTDKSVTTQRAVHSATVDKLGARFIDFFANETLESDVQGLGMHVYSGQDMLVESHQGLTIKSTTSYINLQPEFDNEGNNSFSFQVTDSEDFSNTQGLLLYGSHVNGFASGIRFSKSASDPVVFAVDGNGAGGGNTTFNSGRVFTNTIRKRDGSGGVYWNGSGTGTTGGDTADIDNTLYASGIRPRLGDSWLYLATDEGGAVAVTNYAGYNSGNGLTYRPIYASEFNPASSVRYKDNITLFEESGIDIVKDHQVYAYYLKGDLEEGIYDNRQIGFIAEAAPMLRKGDAISQYKAISINWKATQELIQWKDTTDTELFSMREVNTTVTETITQLELRVQELEAKLAG